jgi:hypothetical protein
LRASIATRVRRCIAWPYLLNRVWNGSSGLRQFRLSKPRDHVGRAELPGRFRPPRRNTFRVARHPTTIRKLRGSIVIFYRVAWQLFPSHVVSTPAEFGLESRRISWIVDQIAGNSAHQQTCKRMLSLATKPAVIHCRIAGTDNKELQQRYIK